MAALSADRPKLAAVTELMGKLKLDLAGSTLTTSERDSALEELKAHCRDPTDADPIFTPEGVETLAQHAFAGSSMATSRAALRVLCNAMLLKPTARQIFVDSGYHIKACDKLRTDSSDDEFLLARVIFLSTYGTGIDLADLVDKHELASSVAYNLERHAERVKSQGPSKAKTDPMDDMALAETAKLLFNTTHFCKERRYSFAPAIPHMLALIRLLHIPAPSTPLDPPLGSLVNALMNLELSDEAIKPALFPAEEPTRVVARLIHLLDLALSAYDGSQLESSASPLVCALAVVYPDAPETVKSLFKSQLLPTEEDRKTALGRTDTLPSRLLRNTNNPFAPDLGKAALQLFFDMSDRDADKLVQNIGYGYASGFLFNNALVPPGAAAGGGSGGAGPSSAHGSGGGKAVNPITGQLLDFETVTHEPEWTEEQKEAEAVKLYGLFEKLRKNGVIQIENPVEQARREGKLDQLDTDKRVEELE